jgi:adenylosuccinate lyase
MDIEDNAEVLRLRASLDVVLEKLRTLLASFSRRVEQYAEMPTMAFTHLQPAEPTTVGYRLALYVQDLLTDFRHLTRVRGELRGKGIKGAVGSSASYAVQLDGRMSTIDFEREVMTRLGLEAFIATNQTYPRKQDYLIGAVLASLAGSLYKFSADLRLLQSPLAGEWSEVFEQGQVGSSAMPFKRNPINAEKVNSLGRMVAHLVGVLWDNAAHSYLERTLDDSANRREILPTIFLAVDEMLITTQRLIDKLAIDATAIQRTLDRFGAFAATERVLMALGKAGADRQHMHARIRDHSMTAWAAIREGQANPLIDLLCGDVMLHQYLTPEAIRALMTIDSYVGDSPSRARLIAAEIQELLNVYPSIVSPEA